jgi:hypothetical protein
MRFGTRGSATGATIAESEPVWKTHEKGLGKLGADLQWLSWYFILRNYINNEQAVKDELFRHQVVFLLMPAGLLALQHWFSFQRRVTGSYGCYLGLLNSWDCFSHSRLGDSD